MSLKSKIQENFSKLKSNRKLQIYIGVASVLVIVVIGGIIIFNNSRKTTENIIQTYTIPENEKIFINGIIVPKQSRDIMGPANGATPDIRVSNGQSVKTGDVLYIVKDEVAIQEISSIKTQISNLIREKRSLENGDPSIAAINNQIATLNTSLSAANAKAYTKVKAPFDGKVYLNNRNGSEVQNGALMTVQTTEYVMNGQISEQDLSRISQDMTADVTVLSSGDTVKGRVSYISDRPVSSGGIGETAEAGGTQISFYSVVLSFDTQEGIVDGYHTQAVIEIDTDKHKIPSEAILNSGSEIYVLTDVDGKIRKTNVEIISDGENYSVVTGNLNQDDVIIKNPNLEMKEGDPVPQNHSASMNEDAKKEEESE